MQLTPNQAQSITTIRSLRGPTLPLLITMLILRRPTNQSELASLTGYTHKPVNQALHYLEALGYATRNHYRRWQLTPDIQLALPGFAEVGKFPTSAPTTTTCRLPPETTKQLLSHTEETVVVVDSRPSGILSHLNQMLASAGIGEPMRSRLLSLPHITRPYLHAHLHHAKTKHTDTALLIHRLLHADHAPDSTRWLEPCHDCQTITQYNSLCPFCLKCYFCHPEEPCQ